MTTNQANKSNGMFLLHLNVEYMNYAFRQEQILPIVSPTRIVTHTSST
jgi:hypothetical protein